MLRYVRYAAAVVFALLAVGFVALWVRSYREGASIRYLPPRSIALDVSSYKGMLWLLAYDTEHWTGDRGWAWDSFPASDDSVTLRNTGLLGFSVDGTQSVRHLTIPHWFLAASSISLATLLAFKRTWRFSLGSALVATTILAALLGLAAYFG